jgi:hypothetical protein
MDTLTPDVFQSPAVAILCGLEHDGFTVELTADGVLSIAPRSRLTPERMQAIAACKDALKQLLRGCDAGVTDRVAEFRRQLAAVPAPRCPAFLFRSDVAYVRGVCFSCGDALPEPRFSRCWRCSLAWRLASRLPVPADLAAALDVARVA